jgi:hypothetical protein
VKDFKIAYERGQKGRKIMPVFMSVFWIFGEQDTWIIVRFFSEGAEHAFLADSFWEMRNGGVVRKGRIEEPMYALYALEWRAGQARASETLR